jgi:hypothetical protein
MPAKNGDFGTKGSSISSFSYGGFLDALKQIGVDGVFSGHDHKNNTSILYEGIRRTYGLKTGKYDAHTPTELGGTLLTLNDTKISVRHLYYAEHRCQRRKSIDCQCLSR